MSGGYFDYKQYQINELVSELEEVINQLKSPVNDDSHLSSSYNEEELEELINVCMLTRNSLSLCATLVNRIDWLLSGDDGFESFQERTMLELTEVEQGFITNSNTLKEQQEEEVESND